MRKKCSTRVRTRGKRVLNSYSRQVKHFAYIQDSPKWTEWNFRTISQRQAESLVAAGEAEKITREVDGVVQVVGYHALTPTSWERPSPATLTMATMLAVAGLRTGRKAADEVLKFRVWALIGDTKAPCVRPAMTPIERHFAEQLLKSNGRMTKAA